MFDVPVDAAYVWFGVGVVSLTTFGVALGLPSAAPPDAAAAGRSVDAVAVGPPGATGTHALPNAERIRLDATRISLDGPGGRTHATFAYPITPAVGDDRLERVLAGDRPGTTFDSSSAFEETISDASDRDPNWRPAPERLTIRRVAWGDVNVTLVG